jgi:hypothetical protein
MKIYARIQDGVVAELFRTASDMTVLFHPQITWIEVRPETAVAEGWTYDGKSFAPPSAFPSAPGPTLEQLQAQLAVLNAHVAALSKSSS